MLVKLQRPPPEIRIFLPMRSARSITAARRPRLPASIAQISPAAPAPTITVSNASVMEGLHSVSNGWRDIVPPDELKTSEAASPRFVPTASGALLRPDGVRVRIEQIGSD